MKLTESELRNMIYEEVLNTLDEMNEGWGEDALNKAKGAASSAIKNVRTTAKRVGKMAAKVATNAGRNIAASNTHQNSQIQQHFVDSMYGKQNKEQESQLAQNKPAQVNEEMESIMQQIEQLNRMIPQTASTPEIQNLLGLLPVNISKGQMSKARGDALALMDKLAVSARDTASARDKMELNNAIRVAKQIADGIAVPADQIPQISKTI